MRLDAFEVAIILAFAFLALEIFTGLFVCLSLSAALLAVAAVEYASGGFDFSRDGILFSMVAVLAFVGLRFVFAAKGDRKTAKKDVNDY